MAQIESSFNNSPPTQSKFWMKEEYKDIVVLDFFSLFCIRREARRAPSLVKLLGSLDVRAFFRWFSADVTGAV